MKNKSDVVLHIVANVVFWVVIITAIWSGGFLDWLKLILWLIITLFTSLWWLLAWIPLFVWWILLLIKD